MVHHDVARTRIERHHLAAVSMRQLAICNAANVKREDGANVAKRDKVEVLHERCPGSSQRVVHGPELGNRGCFAGFRNNGRFTYLQSAAIGAVQPPRNQILAHIIIAQPGVNGWLLINCLAVKTDNLNFTRLNTRLAHE